MYKGVLIGKPDESPPEVSMSQLRSLWADYGEEARRLMWEVEDSGFKPDGIATILRGGALLGIEASHYFNLRSMAWLEVQSYGDRGKVTMGGARYPRLWAHSAPLHGRIILIDDLTDRGETMELARESLWDQYPDVDEVLLVTMFHKAWSTVEPDIYGQEVAPNGDGTYPWLHFPYELKAVRPQPELLGHGGSDDYLTQEG